MQNDTILGQYIPLHYHYQMLADEARLEGFKAALEFLVPKDGAVLDLGSGTGVLSFFAAQKAARVYGVERLPDLVHCSQKLLVENGLTDKVEICEGDARTYLPPEPVDVVVCEMLHAGLLREKQLEILYDFKVRYRKKFDDKLPMFIPFATVLGVEPIFAEFSFQGFEAPLPLFESFEAPSSRFLSLAEAIPFELIEYGQDFPLTIAFDQPLTIQAVGHFNALRFITKNVLSVDVKTETAIDWMNQNLIIPISNPIDTCEEDQFHISFAYKAGSDIRTLQESIKVSKI